MWVNITVYICVYIGKEDSKEHSESGFEDFYDFNLLKQHKGLHVISMEEFLQKEALTGSLKGLYPPTNSSKLYGPRLWNYLQHVADVTPDWGGKFVAFPEHTGDFDLSDNSKHNLTDLKARMAKFGNQRTTVYYNDELQKAHHVHFSSDREHRVLQHHYGEFICC